MIIDVIQRKRQVDDKTILLGGMKNVHIFSHKEERSHYTYAHWAQAPTKALIRIGDQMEPYVVLIDHNLEINIISSDFHNHGRWPIEGNHDWKVKAMIKVMEDLCG